MQQFGRDRVESGHRADIVDRSKMTQFGMCPSATPAAYKAAATIGKLSVPRVAGKSARGPPMQQVTDWLEKLGLSEYAQRFAENDIDFSILPELTDQDLEKIGVSSLGHSQNFARYCNP
jgi:hypothetical protein